MIRPGNDTGAPRGPIPPWLDWELYLSTHVLKRMIDRDFREVDLRAMIEDTTAVRPDAEEGRWILVTRFRRRRWHVIVEPDYLTQELVVVTAYAVE